MSGIVVALLCAITWSCAVILLKFSGARMHPLALNVVKCLLGLPLLYLTTLILEGGIQWPVDWHKTLFLFLSGAIGIGISDGVVLRSMRYLKASQIAMLECLFSPFVILLSVFWFGERPSFLVLLGGVFILASLLFLKPDEEPLASTLEPNLKKGSALMALGLFMMAFGIVMVKPIFVEVPLLSLVTIRMLGGLTAAVIMFAFEKDRRRHFREVLQTPHKVQLLGACFFSSYLSIILWIAGYKYLQATTAALLNQTSTVFTVLLAALFLREHMTRGKVLALISAAIGVVLLTLG
ncbi:MAG: DMT family transporter [Chitinophagaceae bacterium]|nr:DMT family transporter [Oligoflexus sp.]